MGKMGRILLLVLLCLGLSVPVVSANAAPPPSQKAKLLFDVEESWLENYWQYVTANGRTQQLEFDVIGPKYEHWMVSVDGNTFRLRDKFKVNPTIYTKKLSYRSPINYFDDVVKTVVLNADGYFQDVNTNDVSATIRTLRTSESCKFIIQAEVRVAGWKE
ncbi:hypothetical protein ACFPVX_16640 [Cohnella faecalis]|uniref:Uncharacterized protein n=1 Tax=Cohnella faecalis TaxID=2315694 RepID=A0A398CUT8_9BACL|nr:hypothetical protein [Cohnella faecalis]RIE02774.1 hypothetical protein D3H35_19240 [Cohnella faecalis]